MSLTPDQVVYSFEEFCMHYDDLANGEYFGRDRETSTEERTFERTLSDVRQYMRERYIDDVERIYKSGRFVIIMNYLSHNLPSFDQSDYAVIGSERVGALTSTHLLRALHTFYTDKDLLKRNADPTPDEVKALADGYRDSGIA